MRKYKIGLIILLFFMVFGGTFLEQGNKVCAASKTNLIETVSKQPQVTGKWVKTKKGYRYRDQSGKYVKKSWQKIKGKIYFFNRSGYRVTGLKKYKGDWYFLNKKGALTTGWKTLEGEKYYFSKKSGAALTGWNKIRGKKYYFDKQGILQVNQWVKSEYVGEKGYAVPSKRIFIGDSRTVGLKNAVGGSDTFIAKWGEGYQWFSETAVRQLKSILRKYPYSEVIVNLGINDLGNVELYLKSYQTLVAANPRTRFYFLSVNPVEETLLVKGGLSISNRGNEKILEFNQKLKESFPATFIDSFTWMIKQGYIQDLPEGYGTTDGLHYKNHVYQSLYRFVISRTK